MIKYNKEYLDLLNINIGHYKNQSGKIKIPQKDGYCKVYDLKTNYLLFEGQYLKEKKSGKCKEYNINGGIKFEGEYLNGIKNGKCKEYYDYDNIKFEGEYLNGKIWNEIIYNDNNIYKYEIKEGNGEYKEYNSQNKLLFEGKYIKGTKYGKEYDNNGCLIFEGEYLNDLKWKGKIKEYYYSPNSGCRSTCCFHYGFFEASKIKKDEIKMNY